MDQRALQLPGEVQGGSNMPVRRTARQTAATPSRKKGTACTRCRSQKTRCDDNQPCKNCSKVGRPCIRPRLNNNPDDLSHMQQRLLMLEESLRRVAPQELEHVIALTPGVTAAETSGQPPLTSDSHVAGSSPPSQSLSTWPFNEVARSGGNAESLFNGPSQKNALPVESGEHSRNQNDDTETTRPAVSTQIKPSEPFAHDVGLLSLANANEPKYLGPSSGVPFARFILTAISQSQGLITGLDLENAGNTALRRLTRPEPFPAGWTFDLDPKLFVDAYFETYQPFYPFLDEDSIISRLDNVLSDRSSSLQSIEHPTIVDVESRLTAIQSVQLMLIIALGSRISETRLSTSFSSERYLVTAIARIDKLSLHDSIEGVQIMLLLTLCSFCFVDGPNAWFLTSNIIATCLDLGFQREWAETGTRPMSPQYYKTRNNVRSGIFWSAYSLERTLAVVLGRPLTLRDEAIDVKFPGAEDCTKIDSSVVDSSPGDAIPSPHESKRRRCHVSPYSAAQYSFRFDQLTAEMKLMLYRVQNAPGRFPWLTDSSSWQQDAHQRCTSLAQDMLNDLKRHSRLGTSDSVVRTLDLKYCQSLMLLHRPSPAVPRPSLESWKTCHSSAARTLHISAELKLFSKLSNSWLTAHTIFVSGITFLYCLWVKPEIKKETSFDSYNNTVTACIDLLRFLGKSWSVAADALSKFERLVQLTTNSWDLNQQRSDSIEMAAGHSLVAMSNQTPGAQAPPGLQYSDANETELPTVLGGEQSQNETEYQFFFSELGDMSSWFDLEWMMNTDQG